MVDRISNYPLKILLICSGLLGFSSAYGQQMPRFALEKYIAQKINPAYSGSEEMFDIVLITRQQWVGFKGAPSSYLISSNMPLRDKKAGVGLDFLRQQSGPFVQNGLFGSYAYTIEIDNGSSVSFGIRGGLNIYSINLSGLIVNEPGDYLFEYDFDNRVLPNFGTGVHYRFGRYHADLSVPMLFRNDFNSEKSGKDVKLSREDRLYNFQTGSAYSISSDFIMEPWISVWYVKGSPSMIDIHIDAVYKEMAEFGLSYRITGGFGGFISYRLTETLVLGYSYELPLLNDFALQTGTHEVLLGFDIALLKRKTQSPRRF